jgi:hypothetical protein
MIGRYRQRRKIGHTDRVAVWWRCKKLLRADDAAAAGPVLYHELLLERVAQMLGYDSRQCVAATASAEWHDDPDRSVGPVLLRQDGIRRQKERSPSQKTGN